MSQTVRLLPQIPLGRLQLMHLGIQLGQFLLGHECLTNAVRDATLVKRLVGCDGHASLVPNTEQQQTSLGTVDGDLSNQLIETLGVELFADGTNTCLTCLTGLELVV